MGARHRGPTQWLTWRRAAYLAGLTTLICAGVTLTGTPDRRRLGPPPKFKFPEASGPLWQETSGFVNWRRLECKKAAGRLSLKSHGREGLVDDVLITKINAANIQDYNILTVDTETTTGHREWKFTHK